MARATFIAALVTISVALIMTVPGWSPVLAQIDDPILYFPAPRLTTDLDINGHLVPSGTWLPAIPVVDGHQLVRFTTAPDAADIARLAAIGSSLEYLGDGTVLVGLDEAAIQTLAEDPSIQLLGPLDPAWKIQPHFTGLSGVVPASIDLHMDADRSVVIAAVESLGGSIVQELDVWVNILRVEIAAGALPDLAELDEVAWIQEDGDPYSLMNKIQSNAYMGYITPQLTGGYTGSTILAEVQDDGIQQSHPDLENVRFTDGSVSVGDHGTATSGIVFSTGKTNAATRGVLFDGNGAFASWTTGRTTATNNLWNGNFNEGSAGMNGVVQSNSWSVGSQNGQYSTYARQNDLGAVAHPRQLQLWATGNGNDGTQNGRMSQDAVAKNIISVGAVWHQDTSSLNDDQWYSGGIGNTPSRGPAADGRVKPDMAGAFDYVYTTDRTGGYGYSSGDHSTTFGGTSAATPMLAGGAGLVYEMYIDNYFGNNPTNANPYSSTVKALMIADAYQYDLSKASRYEQGWGTPDLQNMYELGASGHYIEDYTNSVSSGQTSSRTVDVAGNKPLKITLAWIDPASSSSTGSSRALINNLDLKVTSPGSTVYYGNHGMETARWTTSGTSTNPWDYGSPTYQDGLNNVENVFIANPAPGTWTVQVIGRSGGVPIGPQGFSLVVSGAGDSSPDTTDPVISSVSAAGRWAASVSWATDEPASSVVRYGATPALGLVKSSSSMTTSHSVVLDGMAFGTTIYFEVESMDPSGNTASDNNGGSLYSVTTQATDDIEAGSVGWTTSGNWQLWGTDKHAGSMAFNAGNGDYGEEWDAILTSPKLDLSSLTTATFSWWQNYDFEKDWDGGVIEVSTTGSSWTRLTPVGGYDGTLGTGYNNPIEGQAAFTGTSTVWVQDSVVLDAYAGNSQVWLRFRMGTDNYASTDSGWSLDDLDLASTSSGTPPSISLSSPNGGESWAVGSARLIVFSASDVEDATSALTVELRYSTDGGATYPNLIGNYAGTASPVPWTVPPAISNQVKVKATVTDTSALTGVDTSNGVFSIIDGTAPAQPTGLGVTHTGPTAHNRLAWSLSADDGGGANDVSAYRIYRATSAGGPWDGSAFVTSVSAGISIYTDTNMGQADATRWWYVVRAFDGSNEETNSAAAQEPAGADSTGPVISAVSSATAWGASVTWTTNENADSRVNFGSTTALGRTAYSASLTTSHSLNLEGLVPGDTYYYDVVSIDGSGNPTTADNAGGHYQFTTSASEGFETGAPGWTVSGGNWQLWGTTVHAGSTAGNAGNGNYGDSWDSKLNSPTLDLSAWTTADLIFWTEYEFETNWDGGVVQVSTDGSAWTTLTPAGGYGSTLGTGYANVLEGQAAFSGLSGWVQKSISLDAFAGQSAVYLRFWIGTDNYTSTDKGWNIDDLQVTGAAAGSPPTISLSTPNGGQSWAASSDHDISWSASDVEDATSLLSVEIRYSTDGGASYPYLIANVAGSSSPYSWTVPGTYSSSVKVRVVVTDTDGMSAADASSSSFSIIDGTPPAPATGLGVDHSGPTANNLLTWTLSTDDGSGANDVSSYRIHRSASSGGPWDGTTLLTTVGAGVASFTDSGAGQADATRWWYVVRAYDGNNDDGNSAARQEPSGADLGGPVISAVADNARWAARVTWTTDELSDSRTNYGRTLGLGDTLYSASDVTSHSQLLTGLTPGGTYFYDVVSVDTAGNPTTADNGGAHYSFLVGDEDFEASAAGWTVSGGNWQLWGTTVRTGSWSGNIGNGGPTGDMWNSNLTSPALDFSSFTSVNLDFWQEYNLENTYDGAVLEAATSLSGPWTRLTPVGGYDATISTGYQSLIGGQSAWTGNSGGWVAESVVLDAWAGQATVYLRFWYVTDSSTSSIGWNLDDLSITGSSGDVGGPAISAVSSMRTLAGQVSWTTDEPSSSRINFGPTAGLGQTVFDATLTTDHRITLQGLIPGQAYFFDVESVDDSGNPTTENNGGSHFTLAAGETDGFDSAILGWTTTDWTIWGTESNSPGFSANIGGGDYGEEVNASIYSPTVSLAGWGAGTLSWYQKYDFETGWDGGVIEIDAGSGWTRVTPTGGYDRALGTGYSNVLEGQQAFSGDSSGWVLETVDLAPFLGSDIMVRFWFASDNYASADAGWSLDDVSIQEIAPLSPPMFDRQSAMAPSYSTFNNPFLVTFVTSEALIANPGVTVNGYPMSYVSLVGETYTYQRTLTGVEGEGQFPIEVTGTDLFGTTTTDAPIGDAILDFTAPVPSLLGAGPDPVSDKNGPLVVTFTTEPLQAPPTLTIAGLPLVLMSHLLFTWQYQLNLTGSEPSGSFPILFSGTDLAGNPTSGTVLTTVELAGPGFEIPISLGWNLISVPTDASGPAMEVLDDSLGDGATTLTAVYAYSPAQGWTSFIADRPAYMNSIGNIDRTVGLWIDVADRGDGFLTVGGSAPPATAISLVAGWNLVGFASQNFSQTAGSALAGLTWSEVATSDLLGTYRLQEVLASDLMVPGQGYWIKVDSAQVWNVPA